jgi:DNA replication protein DnaC
MKQTKFRDNAFTYKNAHLSKIDLNEETAKILSGFLEKPKGFLLYLGSPGCGKTYFCAALMNYLAEKKKRYFYNTERDFFANLKQSMNETATSPEYEIELMQDLDWLILDDIGSQRADNLTDWQRGCLFDLIDGRSQSDTLVTVITSNHFMDDFKENFEPRFYDRLAEIRNTIIELRCPSLRQVYTR